MENSDDLMKYLTTQEKQRFNSIIIPKIKQKFIIHRSLLRLQLSNIIKISPTEITIHNTQYGKPFLNNNNLGISFNLSHSENYAIYAFSLNNEVGIDIEEPRPHMNIFETASLVLAPCEIAQLKNLAPHEQGAAFLKLWTTKEAISKAMGQGLNMNFQQLIVTDDSLHLSHPNIALKELSNEPSYFAMLAMVVNKTI